MSNASSVYGFATTGTSRNQFPVQTVAATTETILQIATDSGTNVNYFLVAPSGGQIYGASAGLDYNANPAITERGLMLYGVPSGESNDQFSSSTWSGHPFKVRVSGVGNAGANAAQTVQVNLYQGTSATVASNKKLGTTGTGLAAVAGGPFNFMIEATLNWDSGSQILSGYYIANVAFGTVSQFTTSTVVSNVVTSVTAALLSFNATLVLGNAASSTIQMTDFVLDRV